MLNKENLIYMAYEEANRVGEPLAEKLNETCVSWIFYSIEYKKYQAEIELAVKNLLLKYTSDEEEINSIFNEVLVMLDQDV